MIDHRTHPSIRTIRQCGLLFVLAFLFSGCALVRPLFAPEPLPALSTNYPSNPVSVRQRITMTYGDDEFTFQSVVELNQNRMVVVGLSSYSTTLFTLQIQGGTVQVDKQSDIPFDLTRLATDLQWSLWPSIPDQEGYTIDEERTESGFVRRILQNGSPAGTVHADQQPPWTGNVRFTHPAGYTMQIKRISSETTENHEQ